MRFKDLAIMTAMMAGALEQTNRYPTSQEKKERTVCSMCGNFPKGTFCKYAKHHVGKTTPAYKCGFFKLKKEEQQ